MEAERWAECERVSYFDPMVPNVSLVKSTDDDRHTPVQLSDEGIGLLSQTHASLRIRVAWQRDVFVLVNPFVAELAHKDVRIRLEVETYQKLVPRREPLKEAGPLPDCWPKNRKDIITSTPKKESVLSKEDMESQILPRMDPDMEPIDIGMGCMEPTIDAWPTGFAVFTTQDEADEHFVKASGKGPFYVRREAIQDNENRFGDRKRKRSYRGQSKSNEDSEGEDGEGFVDRVKRQCRRVVKRQWRGIKRRAYDTWISATSPVVSTMHYLRYSSWPANAFQETTSLLGDLQIPQNLGKSSSA